MAAQGNSAREIVLHVSGFCVGQRVILTQPDGVEHRGEVVRTDYTGTVPQTVVVCNLGELPPLPQSLQGGDTIRALPSGGPPPHTVKNYSRFKADR